MKPLTNIKFICDLVRQSITGLVLLGMLFVTFEPSLGFGAISYSDQFTVSQLVSEEMSIVTPPSDVTMSPTLGGLTGGTANGSTQVIVRTSNITGYNLTLEASSSLGMIGITNPANYIPAYTPSVEGVPDYDFTTAVGTARFGYSVEASTTADLAQIFRNNGSVCNDASGGDVADHCWLNSSTTPVTIVNRSTQTTASGATTTINFRVEFNGTPSPVIPDDTYISTTTITATTN
jgi:hypothetical protein